MASRKLTYPVPKNWAHILAPISEELLRDYVGPAAYAQFKEYLDAMRRLNALWFWAE